MQSKRKKREEQVERSAWIAVPVVLLMLIGGSLIFVGIAGKDGSNQILSKLKGGGGGGAKAVPEGKDADFYFALGLQYKDSGWVERARTALKKAAQLDPNGNVGHSSEVFINIAIPKNITSEDAIMGNITAYNLMAASRSEDAVKKFRELIKDYPNFEWPYGNLGSMYLDDARYDEAEALIDKALSINPCYLNGLRSKIMILKRTHRTAEERKFIRNALDCLGPRNRLEPAIAALHDEFAAMAPRRKRHSEYPQ